MVLVSSFWSFEVWCAICIDQTRVVACAFCASVVGFLSMMETICCCYTSMVRKKKICILWSWMASFAATQGTITPVVVTWWEDDARRIKVPVSCCLSEEVVLVVCSVLSIDIGHSARDSVVVVG
jgi:hypothetical protein